LIKPGFVLFKLDAKVGEFFAFLGLIEKPLLVRQEFQFSDGPLFTIFLLGQILPSHYPLPEDSPAHFIVLIQEIRIVTFLRFPEQYRTHKPVLTDSFPGLHSLKSITYRDHVHQKALFPGIRFLINDTTAARNSYAYQFKWGRTKKLIKPASFDQACHPDFQHVNKENFQDFLTLV